MKYKRVRAKIFGTNPFNRKWQLFSRLPELVEGNQTSAGFRREFSRTLRPRCADK